MSAPARVHVADVQFWTLRRPITEPVRMSFGSLQRRVLAIVELTDADGCTGYGETWANYPVWIERERSATVSDGLRPLLLDAEIDLADPVGSVGCLQQELVRALWPLGRQWGAPGPIMQAISGADQALWDLAGKRLGVPIADVLSRAMARVEASGVTNELAGREPTPTSLMPTPISRVSPLLPSRASPSNRPMGCRARVAAYASGVGPDDVADQVRRCRQLGFNAVKLRVGFGAEVDRANLVAAREQLGADGELLVDANQAWTLDEALAMADALVDAAVTWVEEPIADPTVGDFAAFSARTGLAVAAGENVYGRRAWQALLAEPAVTVLQPDVSKQGGITELLWVCREADAHGKAVEPHLYGGALAYAATLHVAASCREVRRIELDVRPNPLRDDLVVDPPRVGNGTVAVPQGPGLGVVLRSGVNGEHWQDIGAGSIGVL